MIKIDPLSSTDRATEAKAERESIASVEFRPDGEDRFRAAVRAAAKSGPKHREPKR